MNHKSRSIEIGFSFAFVALAIVSWAMTTLAPDSPNETFILACLAIAGISLATVFVAKVSQPKPLNWLTADVLFALGFSLIHFSYFVYWTLGLLDDRPEIWYLRNANVPHVVCYSLAMFLTVFNLFLAGYYLIPTRRFIGVINEQRPPKGISQAWGKMGRLMIRLGFLGFLAFVAIVGPAKFFGVYSGTNNISFVANIFFQLGTVFLMCGMVIAMAARERVLKKSRKKRRLGVSYFDMFLIGSTIVAIGLHGDRSTLLFVFGAFAISYSEYVKPFKFRTLAVTGLTLFFFLGFIIAFRSAKTEEYDFDPINNINAAMTNMGTSAACGFVAVDDAGDDFAWGQMQIHQLMGLIPFSRRLLGFEVTPETSSSMRLTYLIQGRTGPGVAGTGTSVFADFYFDFGFYGTALLFLLMGILAKWVQNKARGSTSIIWQVFLINLVTFLAIVSRYSFTGGFIRYVLFAAIYTYVIAQVLSVPTRYRRPASAFSARPAVPGSQHPVIK